MCRNEFVNGDTTSPAGIAAANKLTTLYKAVNTRTQKSRMGVSAELPPRRLDERGPRERHVVEPENDWSDIQEDYVVHDRHRHNPKEHSSTKHECECDSRPPSSRCQMKVNRATCPKPA